MRIPALALLVAVLGGCGGPPPEVSGCVARDELVPICGFQRPEDIELLPDRRTLLISQMGEVEGAAQGALALFDTHSETITRLPQFTPSPEKRWGAAGCEEPPGAAFSPHGIDLLERPDGDWQVLAVNHGGRESVELFELLTLRGSYRLEWRGCVPAPPGAYLNDVAGLPDGSFLVSHMFPRDGLRLGGMNVRQYLGLLGFNTGHVLRCTTDGCTPVPGTTAPFPNGVQVDPAGRHLYLNAYFGGEVRKVSLRDGRVLGRARVEAPDNSQWDADGRLLVASHTAGRLAMRGCRTAPSDACGAAFEIVALDPESLETETVFRHAGAPMGAATVAQRAGEHIYLGSFTGNRILRVPLAATALANR